MKRTISLIAALVLAASLSACTMTPAAQRVENGIENAADAADRAYDNTLTDTTTAPRSTVADTTRTTRPVSERTRPAAKSNTNAMGAGIKG